MGRRSTRRAVQVIDAATPSGTRERVDTLAVEEPLELRIAGEPLSITMRTPGDDVELAHGLLLAEGIIAGRADVRSAHRCGTGAAGATGNALDLTLGPGLVVPSTAARRFVTTSACGICGADAIADVRDRSRIDRDGEPLQVARSVLLSLPDLLRAKQRVFARTGGLHAAGLFTTNGDLLCVREDVGRHNAVDKVVGWCVMEDLLPATTMVLAVSGRASFELVQKAAAAGIPVLVAVSAPSSLAVELAEELGLTLLGFARGGSANVYAHPERVV